MDSGLDHKLQNKQMQDALVKSIESIFPVVNSGKRLELLNIRFEDKLNDNDFPDQKRVKLDRKSWHNPVFADFNIVDDASGRVINKAQNIKIANIPKITNRFTAIIDGNEYQTTSQIRRKSGVYSRIKKNGELESEFNLSKGQNFKMQLDPVSQLFVISFENRKYRLWTLLNTLGVSDQDIRKVWGTELLEINKKGALNTEISEMGAIYKKLSKKDPTDYKEVINFLNDYFATKTEIDPDTTKITLGKSFKKIDGETLLEASKKLLLINRGEDKPDERDSLIFKRLYTTDDLLASYFEKQAPSIKKKLERTLGFKEHVKEVISAATFGEPIKRFFTVGDLSATPPQTNPVTMIAEWRKTTPMGTGGIQSSHAITNETRDIQPTHLGFFDVLASPESLKIGVNVGLTSEAKKYKNDLATPVVDMDGKIHQMTPIMFFENVVGFPDQYTLKDGKVTPRSAIIKVMERGVSKEVPAKDVKYFLRSPRTMFSFQTNLVPFIPNTQGNRASTGARMITQALSIDAKEAPLVRTYRDKKSTYQDALGEFLNPTAEFNGTISKIDKDYIYIKKDGSKEVSKIGLYNDFPLNQDGFLQSKVLVKVGDKVTPETVLTENNYSTGKVLSLGKNLNVAYMSYKGLNFEDGVVITQSAAQKMTHSMLHRINIFYSPKLSVFDKKKFNAWYPDEMSQDNFAKLDDKGIIKVGETVNSEDIVCAFLIEKEMDDVEQALKKLDKYTFNNYSKSITIWDEEDPGIVTDVKVVGRNVDIYIKSKHPLREGDKIAGSYGNKGIVTKIIPDSEAPHRANGEPIDLLLSPEGVPGRMNIGQVLETGAARIAEKTGKPYIVNNFGDPDDNAAQKVFAEMKQYGITPDETLIDGKTGKPIDTPIFIGKQYIMKLRHIVKKKQGVHSFGTYDTDEQPTGKGVQKIGILDSYVYLAHGAKHNLREMSEIKGRKNEEYWRDLQFGLPPGRPNRNFVFEKLVTYLKGAGINVDKNGNRLRILPITDADVDKWSSGELKDPGALLIGKNLASRKGGLFDTTITGGIKGTNWSHINLVERIPNPMYEDAIIKALNLTEKDFESVIHGKKELDGKTGTEAIVSSLKNLNIDSRIKLLKAELKTAPPTNVNKLNAKLKNMLALQDLKYTPVEAYTMQKLPIIPPQFRTIYPLPSGDLMVSDINKHYRDVGLINQNLNNIYSDLTDKDRVEGTASLYRGVKALQGFIDPMTYSKEKYKGFIKELSEMKSGLIQGTAWTKPQDLSGRSTITVEPDLGLDEVGIPKNMAYTMYKPFVIRELKQSGIKAADAKKYYDEEHSIAKNALQEVVKQRPLILNRAPSLHKHSVQAFKPVLMDGKSIRLNPLIIKGFNADFDGDTMSMMVPVTKEAVEEAKGMFPSNILFKHGDNSLMPDLSKDYIYGLYELSLITGDSGKKFSSINEAKQAGIKWTDTFKLNGKSMTIGQYMINSELPEKYRDYTRVLNAKTAKKVLEQLGKENPQYFTSVINSWKDMGAMFSYVKGHTVSLNDFTGSKKYRENILKVELPKINKLKGSARIDALNALTKKVEIAQNVQLKKDASNFWKMQDSGTLSGGKAFSITQIVSMPGVLTDINGQPLEMPVLKSYGEGLDAASYWNSLYSVRKGTVDRAVNTQESGALNKSLLTVNRRVLITIADCNTEEGLEIELDNKNVMDRTLLFNVVGVGKRNQVVNSEVVQKARAKGIVKLKVRSPLTCEAVEGICQKCYGLMPNGQLPSIGENVGILDSQAVTERATQLTMQTFHSGGVAAAGGGITAGFPRLEQLLKVPEKLSGKATLTDVDGAISSITKNPTGGYNILVGSKPFIITAGRLPIVTLGQSVKKGDPLSDGIIKPQELGEYKSHLDAQKYLIKEMGDVYNGQFYDKTFETVVRGISDNAEITEAPEDSGFYRGDKTSKSSLDFLNKERKKDDLPLISYRPYFKSIDTLNTDNNDWFTKITTNRVKAGLTTGAAKGQYANIKGKDPVPAFIYGDNFGRNTDYEQGSFY